MSALEKLPRVEDMRFTQAGLYAEATRPLRREAAVGGFRATGTRRWTAARASPLHVSRHIARRTIRSATDRKTLPSVFGRYEHDLDAGGVSGRFSLGVGHTERSPDYWERLKQDPVTLKSAFLSTRPEVTTQVDAGMVWRSNALSGSVAAFYSTIHDYVLIRWQPSPTLTRNVDATSVGGEATAAYSFARFLKGDATLAYVRSDNATDHKPLAQQPPLEARLGLHYSSAAISFGVLARVVGTQNRVDVGSGNIVSNGKDLGPTGGFTVFSINGGYRWKGRMLVTAGVDNVLDRAYAEHISQSGAMVPGFVTTTRINEPGRTFWLQVNFTIG
jgi:iron complex outermembrane receptor protein